MKYIELENLINAIRSNYNISFEDYILEQELINDFQRNFITKEEFIDHLKWFYEGLERYYALRRQ